MKGGKSALSVERRWGAPARARQAADKTEDSGDRPRKARLVLRPDAYADRLSDVSLDALSAAGIAGIVVDLDNTLVGYGEEQLSVDDARWIAAALQRGFRICLLSNNFTGRVARVASELGVPAISSALKPLPRAFEQALRVLGTPKRRTVVVGDQLFTDVLGAKLVGIRCILTRPLVEHDWYGTRVLRFFERLFVSRP